MSMGRTTRDVGPGDRVLVTGAAGGVGRHVVRALLDAGCELVCVDLRTRDYRSVPEVLGDEDVEWVSGDLLDLDLDELTRGCTAIVHAAAFVGLSESYDELAPTNVDLVADLMDSAERMGVRHLVHFSAGTIYRPGRGLRSEGDKLQPTSDYEQTKVDSESMLARHDGGLEWTILRPAHIYGPHCESMGAGLVTLPPILRNFTPYVPAFAGGTRSSWVHVEDVAAAALAVLGNPSAYGHIYNVADDTPLGFGEALTAMIEAYGFKVGPSLPFPSPTVLMTFSPVVDREYTAATMRTLLRQVWNRIVARHGLDTPLRPKVDRSVIFYVADDTVLDNSALSALGWQPKYPSLAEGITDAIQWYQDHGWVPRFDTESQVRVRDENDGVGFSFEQVVNGSWTDTDGEIRPVELDLEVEFPRVSQADLSGRINGTATFEGLVELAPVEGTIELALFSRRKILYEFGFEANVAHRCRVETDFSALRPVSSLSQLGGAVYDELGNEVGKVDLHLELADRAVALLTSFRLL